MDIKKIVVILSFLCGVSIMCIYANDESISEIIFWDYSENLSLEILEENSLQKNLETFKTALAIPLSECSSFSKNTQEFFLIDGSTKWKNGYGELFINLIKRSDGGSLYFSIAIDGKIVMNGLNRVFNLGAAKKNKDDLVVPRIVWNFENDTLALTMNYDFLDIDIKFSSQEDEDRYIEYVEEDRRQVYREEIEVYFSLRNKLQ